MEERDSIRIFAWAIVVVSAFFCLCWSGCLRGTFFACLALLAVGGIGVLLLEMWGPRLRGKFLRGCALAITILSGLGQVVSILWVLVALDSGGGGGMFGGLAGLAFVPIYLWLTLPALLLSMLSSQWKYFFNLLFLSIITGFLFLSSPSIAPVLHPILYPVRRTFERMNPFGFTQRVERVKKQSYLSLRNKFSNPQKVIKAEKNYFLLEGGEVIQVGFYRVNTNAKDFEAFLAEKIIGHLVVIKLGPFKDFRKSYQANYSRESQVLKGPRPMHVIHTAEWDIPADVYVDGESLIKKFHLYF